MGQCQCLSNKESSHALGSPGSTLSRSPTPATPNTIKKKRENLIINLMEDFQDKSFSHLFSSEVNIENFEVIKVIGRGSFAKVYLVKMHDE